MIRWILTIMVVALMALPEPASAGLLSKLGRMADGAGDGAKKVDGVGGTDIPSTALRAARDLDGNAVAMSVSDTGTIRLTDEQVLDGVDLVDLRTVAVELACGFTIAELFE